MWNKIYLVLLVATTLTMSILLLLPNSWLGSVTDPRNVAQNYTHYSNISWTFLLISSVFLLIAANGILLKTGRTWAMWASLAYFAVFMIAQTFWLEQNFFRYQQANNLTDSAFFLGSIYGVALIALAAVIVFFNQYLIKRMQTSNLPADTLPVENDIDRKAV
jgi:uncharacterized membrane protein SirB2